MNASTTSSSFPLPLNNTNNDTDRRNFTGFPAAFWRARLQDDDLGPTTRVSVWILVGASLLFVLMRVYCKIVRHRRLHADVYFAIAAWVIFLVSLFSRERQS